MNEEPLTLFKISQMVSKYLDGFEEKIQKKVEQSEYLLVHSDFITNLKGYLSKSNSALIKQHQHQIAYLEKEIENFRFENHKLREKSDALELRIFNYTQEIEKHRRNTRLSLIFSDPNEKICGLCQKVYKPNENFNWSCKHHRAKVINNVWFCCGKIGQNAPGCLLSKHICVEELEELVKDEQKYVYCNTCKNKDHNTNECPFDPNVRTFINPVEELKRLQHNENRKIQNKSKVNKIESDGMKKSLPGGWSKLSDSDISDFDIEDIITK